MKFSSIIVGLRWLGEKVWSILAYHGPVQTSHSWRSGANWRSGLAPEIDRILREDHNVTMTEDRVVRDKALW